MSLELVRIDVRLIHGQVTCGWLPHVAGTCVVVANDQIYRNKSIQTLMRMSLPEDIQLFLSPVSGAGILLTQRELKQEKILLLFSSIQDLKRGLEAGLEIKMLNVGSTGPIPQGISLTKTVSVTREELEFLERLAGRGIEIDLRMVPMDHPLNFQKILAKVKDAAH
jgi:mannose/fructose/N-acetylgalactosamine-specific phosphotransferase system component IIB